MTAYEETAKRLIHKFGGYTHLSSETRVTMVVRFQEVHPELSLDKCGHKLLVETLRKPCPAEKLQRVVELQAMADVMKSEADEAATNFRKEVSVEFRTRCDVTPGVRVTSGGFSSFAGCEVFTTNEAALQIVETMRAEGYTNIQAREGLRATWTVTVGLYPR